MKCDRPLFVLSFSILAGMYTAVTMPRSLLYGSLALFAFFTVFHFFTRNRYTLSLIITLCGVVAAIFYFDAYQDRHRDKIYALEQLDGGSAYGIVKESHTSYASSYYTVTVSSFNGTDIEPVNVNVYTDDILSPGDMVIMQGRFKGFSPASNYRYNYSNNIDAYFYADSIALASESSFSFRRLFYQIKSGLTQNMKRLYDTDTAPIAAAMGFGDKSLLSNDVNDKFRSAGLSHALVVSGLHVGFIVAAVNRLMYFLPVSKRLKNIAAAIFVLLFMGIAGFTPSIIRAGSLIIVYLLGRSLVVETDSFTVLAVVVLVSVLQNPYSAVNASLLLSYSAYFGVVYAAQFAAGKNFNKLFTGLLVSAGAVAATSPVMALLGMDTTLLAPVFNLLRSPFIMVVCVLSFFTAIICYIPVFGAVLDFPLVFVNKVCIHILLYISRVAEDNFGFAMINLGESRAKFIIACTVVAFGFVCVQLKNPKIKIILLRAVPLVSFLCYNYADNRFVTVKAFDSSRETSFVVSGSKNYLILAQDIDRNKLESILSENNLTEFDGLIYCLEDPGRADLGLCKNSLTVTESGHYDFEDFSLEASVEKGAMKYIFDVCGTTFSFSHKKAEFSGENTDYYFYGNDAPEIINSQKIYYFYPLLKSQTEQVQNLGAVELYDTLTIKIDRSSGKSFIVRDVKNFGYGI